MNKIYLHIGAGKTGSSALQVWLNQNTRQLREEGVYYPTFDTIIEDDYLITSGNGVYLLDNIKKNNLKKFFKSIKSHLNEDILFSSEALQILNEDELGMLNDFLKKNNYKIEIIIYVRNLYEMQYSSYKQLVKRNNYVNTFNEFISNAKNIQQFDVLYRYEKIFENITLIHYDSNIPVGIEKIFCDVLNVDSYKLEPMKKKKVNRSLDFLETELLRYANKVFLNYFDNESFSRFISDKLIYKNPEKETELYIDNTLIELISKRFQKDIDYVNEKYLSSTPLCVFNSESKHVITEGINIPIDFLDILNGIVEFFSVQVEMNIPVKKQEKVDLVGLLFGEAIKRETNFDECLQLLKAARVLRPDGTIIKEKIIEMEKIEMQRQREGVK